MEVGVMRGQLALVYGGSRGPAVRAALAPAHAM